MSCKEKHGNNNANNNNNANAAQMCKERLADTNGVDSVVCVCVFPIINVTFADRISRYYIISTVENMFQEYSNTHNDILVFVEAVRNVLP